MYAITRRALPAAALAVLISATVPVTHSQSGTQIHLDLLQKQVDRLEDVPVKLAGMAEELRQMREEERRTHEKTGNIEVGIVVGLSVIMVEMLTRALGLRIGKGRSE